MNTPATSAPLKARDPVAIVGLALVVIVAAVLRLGWPGIESFGFDEARVSLLALEMARQGQVPAVGIPSSAGVPNPAAFVWLTALPYALNRDPLFATLAVGLANIAAAAGVWALARRWWGAWAALTAGLLFASSPYSVVYSRSIWSQDLMAPLAVLWAWCGANAIERRSGGWLAAHVLCAGIAWQVHFSGAALLPVSLWLILRYRLWRRTASGSPGWRWIVAGALLPVAAAAPYAAAMLGSDGALSRLANIAGDAGSWHWDAVQIWLQTAIGSGWEWLPLGSEWSWSADAAAAQAVAHCLTAALLIAGIVALVVGRRRADKPAPATLLIPWALAAPAIFLYSRTPVYHQYMLTALPAVGLAAGATARDGLRRWLGPLVGALALLITLVQGSAAATSIAANVSQLQPGGMGAPLLYPRAMAASLRDGAPIVSHTRNADPAYDADASGMSVLFWGYDHRVVNGQWELVLPPQGQLTHLLFVFPDIPALELARQYALVESEQLHPRRAGEPDYVVLNVNGVRLTGFEPGVDAVLDNGARLIGWRAARAEDGSLELLTAWQVTDAWKPAGYHQFNHLCLAGEPTPAQVQDAPLTTTAWRAGDTVITRATFEAIQGDADRLEVGMYGYPDLARVTIGGADGAMRLTPVP